MLVIKINANGLKALLVPSFRNGIVLIDNKCMEFKNDKRVLSFRCKRMFQLN